MPREAIVITNPKWELFTKASDAFKSATPPAVLVVRGHNKEKKPAKVISAPAKKMSKAAAFIAVAMLSISAFAADISGNLPVLMLDAASTNAGPGQGVFGWQLNDIAVTQISVTTTNVAHITTRSNVIVRLETSLNGQEWVAAGTMEVQPGAAADTYVTSLATITNTTGGKWLRIAGVENVNTNRIWLAHVAFEIQ